MNKKSEGEDIWKSFEEIKKINFGARDYKVDLHFHTPASEDARGKNKYGHNPYKIKFPTIPARATSKKVATIKREVVKLQEETLEDSREIAAKIVDRFIEERLSLAAITDHNSQGFSRNSYENVKYKDIKSPTWYEIIAEEAAKRNREAEKKIIEILPGIEISCMGIHILAIFPPEKPRSIVSFKIGYLLDKMGFTIEQWGRNKEVGKRGHIDAVRIITELGALAIPAHIDGSDQAVLDLYKPGSGALKNVFWEPNLHAVEIVKPSKMKKNIRKKKYSFKEWIDDLRDKRGLQPLAYLQGSDAHDLDTIGKRFSYVKMTEPSFAGLKAAIIDPHSRVRISDEYSPVTAGTFLYGIDVKGGFADKVKVRFNRHFNCVIGKRGSGKTTLVNLIKKSCDPSIKEPAGSINLFVEKMDGGKSQYYCFMRRQREIEDLRVFQLDEERRTIEELSKDLIDKLSIKPKIYKPEKIQQIIANRKNLSAFIEKHFSTGGRRSVANVFNEFYQKQRFLSKKKKQILRLEESAEGVRLYIITDDKKHEEQEFFTLDKGMKIATIMLILVCNEKFGPVTIDSPEDHLDNEGIFNFIVPRIRELNNFRQLLLFSDNPNIAVPGDPENIMVLEGKEKGIKRVLTGCSIEKEEIKDNVTKILEGGIPAFTSRKLKYEQ